MSYAEGTDVPVERSKAELDRLLAKHGATQRVIGSDDVGGFALCVFAVHGRQVRLRVPLLAAADAKPPKGSQAARRWHYMTESQRAEFVRRRIDQVSRERWRALLLLVKAKLELVDLGLSTFEREFLADIYLPNGKTVHEALAAQLADAYLTGAMPPLLGMGGGT